MPSHYWMVGVNLLLLVIALLSAFFIIKKSPNKKINYPLLLLLFSLLPCFSILRIGSYESGDFIQHVYRAMVFYDAVKEGIAIPSWADALNSGYGYPVFMFIYLTPYYLMSAFHALGISFILSGKLVLIAAYVFSGFAMYGLLRTITKNSFAAFGGAIIYLYSPYHLVDLHFRVAMAEVIAFTIVPFLLYFLIKTIETKKIIYMLVSGLLFGLLFLTHPAQFIFYTALFSIYLIYKIYYEKLSPVRPILLILCSLLLGLIISSFSWLARFTLTQYTYGSKLINIPVSFATPQDLLFSPWRWGFLFQGSHGELSFLIGYTQILLLLFAIYLLVKRKYKNTKYKEIYFWIIISVCIIFCMLPYSKFIWDTIPFLNLMQFSYRLLHPLIFSLSLITAFVIVKYQKNQLKIYLFLLITIAYTVLNWGHRHMLPALNDTWARNNIINTTKNEEGMIEANPLWYSPHKYAWIQSAPKQPLEILNGKAEYKLIDRSSVARTYIVYAYKPTRLVENTFYFPNWTITVNNTPTKITYTDTTYPGRMLFDVPPGLHYVVVKYEDIPIIKFAKQLSLVTVGSIVLYLLLSLIRLKLKIINEKKSHL